MPAWGDAFKRTKGIAAPTADAAIRNLAQYIASLQRQPRK
jgi:cytochrome c553